MKTFKMQKFLATFIYSFSFFFVWYNLEKYILINQSTVPKSTTAFTIYKAGIHQANTSLDLEINPFISKPLDVAL